MRKFAVLAFAILAFASPAIAADSPVEIPRIVISNIPFDITINAPEYNDVPFALMIVVDGEPLYAHNGIIPATLKHIRIPASGHLEITLSTAGQTWESTARSIPGWLTLLPPLIAILAALLFRQVYVALFAGIWLGAFIIKDFNPLAGLLYVVDHYVVDSLAGGDGWDHTSIAVFTLLLGGLVGIISANGGAQGVVNAVSRMATNARRGQIATWLMGLAIFFDDYTNTLIVGNTMRPITDRLRISREKLAYIVDSTAAPVTCIAVITSWVGFQISLLNDAFQSVGMLDRNPFTTFVASIPYAYYPILALFFVFLVAWMGRDYGPMLAAERRARRTGEVLAPGANPISNIDTEVKRDDSIPKRWINALLPILVVIFGTLWGLIQTGQTSLAEAGNTSPTMFDALREGNSFVALLWSSFLGCVVALLMTLVQRLLSLGAAVNAMVSGIKAMTPAILILILAWSIGKVCTDLHTADFLVASLSGVIAPELLPGIIFIVAAAVSFSTGTSWGTMTILTPLCVPLVIQVTQIAGMPDVTQNTILLSSIASILSGAVFGDHCSPISDTTIMSSMACTADHVDHVRTQLPYAMTVSLVAVTLGYVPAALGLPTWIALIVSALTLFAILRFFGRPVPEAPQATG